MIDLNNKTEKLKYVLDLAWNIFFERLISKKISINLESSMQLHYASIIKSIGELFIITPYENFKIELEHSFNDSNKIDIECSYNNTKAAIELKCFRKGSNRAMDMDMYDVLKDIERLESLSHHKIKKFICLTDNSVYLDGKHSGHAGIVSIKDKRMITKNTIINPTWKGVWKSSSRDNSIRINSEIQFNWIRKEPWYYLIIDL